MKININNHVKIKLTEYGKDILNDIDKNMFIHIPIQEDEHGYSEWQLWETMNIFGKYLGLGKNLPFETVILMDE